MKFDNNYSVNRLGIYFFYDKQGVVDDYVLLMLNELKNNCSEICIVVNGILTEESKEKLLKYVGTKNLVLRDNKGFDVWAYKTALELYGWEKLSAFDEMVLMNFTLMGPLYPFSEMFSEMNKKDLDFWGITKHHGLPYDPFGTSKLGYIPEHIQSSFICVRKAMLSSSQFQQYWAKMKSISSYQEAIGCHEAIFTKTFNDYGFKSDVYVETDDLKPYTDYPLMIKAKELVENRRCPVFKRKIFSNFYTEFLQTTIGEPAVELLDYIKEHELYDINLIWDNILRVDNMADIKARLHLNYILPKDEVINKVDTSNTKVALIIHIYYADQIPSCKKYMESMPENADIIITTPIKENVTLLNEAFSKWGDRVKILFIENRGRDVSSLLVAARPYVSSYDLICFAHDKKTTQIPPYSAGEGFSYKCFENILGSRNYVKNVIETFVSEPRLGMLAPPPPNHAGFFRVYGNEWLVNYVNTKKLAGELDLHVDLDEKKEPMAPLGTMFWFRPEALKDLFTKEWKYEDFPEEPNKMDGTILHAIERVYGYAAQNQGYYFGWCFTDKYACIEMTNLHYMLHSVTETALNKLGPSATFDRMNMKLKMLGPSKVEKRFALKELARNRVPKGLWKFLQKVYTKLGGKAWLDETFYG